MIDPLTEAPPEWMFVVAVFITLLLIYDDWRHHNGR